MELTDKILESLLKPYQDKIAELEAVISELKSKQNEDYQSSNINDLAASFAKAQGEYSIVYKNRQGHFKGGYADLEAIIETITPVLSKHGLAFYQYTKLNDREGIVLHSRLLHSTGQWIETRNRIIPAKNEHQEYGKAVSYMRRYAALSLLRLATAEDPDDDDGAREMIANRDRIIAPVSAPVKKTKDASYMTITPEQVQELEEETKGFDDYTQKVLTYYQITDWPDLPKSDYMIVLNKIRNYKANLDTVKK